MTEPISPRPPAAIRTESADGPALDRRTFLTWTTAAAAAPWIGTVAASPAAAATVPADVPVLPMSVGWVANSDLWQRLDRVTRRISGGRGGDAGQERLAVLTAERLLAGDQTLANETVRIKIHGIYPGTPGTRTAVGRVRLTVLFPSDDPQTPGPFPFFAWEFEHAPRNVSAPVAFVAPLGTDGSLRLVMDVLPSDGGHVVTRRGLVGGPAARIPAARYVTDFTVDWAAGRPKLLGGAYLLGLSPNAWASDRALPVAEERVPIELQSLVLTVERAPEPA